MKTTQNIKQMTITFHDLEIDGDGWCEDVIVPAVAEVCGRCRGSGVHDHPCFSNGITQSEMAEMEHDDPGFREQYFGGRYDVVCEDCGGEKVMLFPDTEVVDPKILKAIEEAQRIDWEIEAEARAERRYFGGY